MLAISDLLKKEILEKFKVETLGTLFGPDWNMLEKRHCPICTHRLYEMRNRPLFYCRNKKHKKFVISISKI